MVGSAVELFVSFSNRSSRFSVDFFSNWIQLTVPCIVLLRSTSSHVILLSFDGNGPCHPFHVDTYKLNSSIHDSGTFLIVSSSFVALSTLWCNIGRRKSICVKRILLRLSRTWVFNFGLSMVEFWLAILAFFAA